MSESRDNPLELDPDAMRRLGYRVVDAIVDYMSRVEEMPVIDWQQPPDAARALQQPFPATARDPQETIDRAIALVFGNTMRLTHPRFYAYIPGPGNFVSTLADFMTSGFNVFAGVTPHNAGAFEVERMTIDWLGSECGWDFANSGLFVSGGSAATFTALAVARHEWLCDESADAVVYCSSQTHTCVERALYLLGFKANQLRLLEPGADFRLAAATLTTAIEADRANGRRPFCLVANAGTTNTGAIDPLPELAEVCEHEGLWLHVDAAYGGGALLSHDVKPLFAGIERAHTIAIDPHKLLFQPFECACVLGRERNWFLDPFRRVPAYMRDTDAAGDDFNYRDMGLQVTRSFKAFKLWLSLHVYGVDTFRAAIDRGLALARYAQSYVESHDDWDLVSPATLGVLTCRYRVAGASAAEADRFNAGIAREVSRSGYAYVTTTTLNQRTVLRFCPVHPGATRTDIDGTFARLERAAEARS